MPIFYDQSFNDMLTNNIIRFEQLGPVIQVTSSLIQVRSTQFII